MAAIGIAHARLDGRLKVTGEAHYGSDVPLNKATSDELDVFATGDVLFSLPEFTQTARFGSFPRRTVPVLSIDLVVLAYGAGGMSVSAARLAPCVRQGRASTCRSH